MTTPTVHNYSTYTNHRCRCEQCRTDWAKFVAKRRKERRQLHHLITEHNESTYTNWGCRCDECRQAHAAYARTRRGGTTTKHTWICLICDKTLPGNASLARFTDHINQHHPDRGSWQKTTNT